MIKVSQRLPALLALSGSLRSARIQQGVGLRRLADKLGISPPTLSAWENGQRSPSIEDVAHILGFLRVSPTEYKRIMRLRRQLDDPISIETLDGGSASLQKRAFEEFAVRTFEWAPHVVPEPLRAPEYIRAILQDRASSADDIDQAIFAHQVRQLDQGQSGPRTVLLGAAALDPAIEPQLQAIHTMAHAPNQNLRIVPASSSLAKTTEPFTIYETGDKDFTVALRHQDNIIFICELEAVQSYRSTFEALERESVAPSDYQPAESC